MTVKYARAAGGAWTTAATWSLSSGGPADTTAPGAGDDLIIDTASGLVTNVTGSATSLTITNGAVKTTDLTMAGTLTLSGALSVTGNSAVNRVYIRSNVPGTARTISAATVSLTNVDFQDITGAGAASWTGTTVGNALGNTNITFTTPVTRYGVVAGNWSNTATWSSTSGGGGGSSVPLPQDAVILDANSAAGTYNIDMPRICASLTMTGFTRTLALGLDHEMYGSVAAGSGQTISGTSTVTHAGRSSHTLTSAGKTWTGRMQFAGVGSTYTLADAYVNSRTFLSVVVSAGTLNDGGFGITTAADMSVSAAGSIVFSGTTTLNGTASGNIWSNTSSGTVTHSGTIVIGTASANSRNFVGGGKTYGTLTYTVAGSTGALVVTGANTFGTINFSDVTNARTLTMPTSSGTTVTGTFNVNGTSGKLMTVTGDLTKSSGIVSCDYLSLTNSDAAGGATFYAGANSTNGGGNTGWVFTAPPTATPRSSVLAVIGMFWYSRQEAWQDVVDFAEGRDGDPFYV